MPRARQRIVGSADARSLPVRHAPQYYVTDPPVIADRISQKSCACLPNSLECRPRSGCLSWPSRSCALLPAWTPRRSVTRQWPRPCLRCAVATWRASATFASPIVRTPCARSIATPAIRAAFRSGCRTRACIADAPATALTRSTECQCPTDHPAKTRKKPPTPRASACSPGRYQEHSDRRVPRTPSIPRRTSRKTDLVAPAVDLTALSESPTLRMPPPGFRPVRRHYPTTQFLPEGVSHE